jgi:probable F420-dependent oxidoreductase
MIDLRGAIGKSDREHERSKTMKIGAVFSQADSGTDPELIRRFARTAEDEGFRHLMAYDHVLGASPERLGPGPFGSFPSAPYTHEHVFHEILVLFSHLAAVTTRLEFVTSVLLLPQRETALAAKQIATIDLLSGGRLRIAVGVGWNRVEYESLGYDFTNRTKRLEEQIDVLRKLWTERLVTFHGRYHDLDRVGINPLPSRSIPILIGSGAAEPTLRRVVRKADGWMPLLLPGLDKEDVATGVERLRRIAAEEGRDPASLAIHGRVYLGDGWQREVERALKLGFSDLSVGYNRMANPGRSHEEHLDAIVAVMPEIDRIVG